MQRSERTMSLPVDPAEPFSEKEDYGNEVITRKQVVMPFTMGDWEVIKRLTLSYFPLWHEY